MPWNKRVMQFRSERKFDLKDFHSEKLGATPGMVYRHPTKLEVVEAEYDVELDIDFEKIFEVMGRRAALAKSGRCVDGFVKVKAKKRREISREVKPAEIPAWWKEVAA